MSPSDTHKKTVPPWRVLVVDDMPVNRLIASKIVRSLGYEVVEVSGGESAITLLRSERFDLVLLDLHMPSVDGYAVTKAVRAGQAGHSDIPIIAITADVASEARCRNQGMNGWLVKPVRFKLLRELVMGLLAPSAPKLAAS